MFTHVVCIASVSKRFNFQMLVVILRNSLSMKPDQWEANPGLTKVIYLHLSGLEPRRTKQRLITLSLIKIRVGGSSAADMTCCKLHLTNVETEIAAYCLVGVQR